MIFSVLVYFLHTVETNQTAPARPRHIITSPRHLVTSLRRIRAPQTFRGYHIYVMYVWRAVLLCIIVSHTTADHVPTEYNQPPEWITGNGHPPTLPKRLRGRGGGAWAWGVTPTFVKYSTFQTLTPTLVKYPTFQISATPPS